MIARVQVPCVRCGGAGEIPRFRHYAKGVCFLCGGSGSETVVVRETGAVEREAAWIAADKRAATARVIGGAS